jgi:hypothetical protein
MVQIRQNLSESPLGCPQTCKKQQANNPKDAQKHFGQLVGKVKTYSEKLSKLKIN